MDEREIVIKVNQYLQGQPKGQRLTYSQIASAIELPYEAGRIKRIIRRSDNPYYRAVLGGVKTMGTGSKKIQTARSMALSQRRGFLRKIFEKDPEATMRPGVGFSADGRIKLGHNDSLDDSVGGGVSESNSKPDKKPKIDLAS